MYLRWHLLDYNKVIKKEKIRITKHFWDLICITSILYIFLKTL